MKNRVRVNKQNRLVGSQFAHVLIFILVSGLSSQSMVDLNTNGFDDVWEFNCGKINGIKLEAFDNDINVVNVQLIDSNKELVTDAQDISLLDLRGSIVRDAQKFVSLEPVEVTAIIITTKTDNLDGLEASYNLTLFTE